MTPPRPDEPREPGADTATLAADAERFLVAVGDGGPMAGNTRNWFGSVAKAVRRTSKTQHLRAIALAYATLLRIEGHPEREAVLKELESTLGRKRSARTRDLHLIVEHFIAYGASTPAERTAARKLYSRDVRAIEHLRAQRIRPSRVEELSKAKGEGLDRWVRRVARPQLKRNTKTVEPGLSPKREAFERSLRYEVVFITRRPDSTRVRRQRLALTGVLKAEVQDAMKRFAALRGKNQ